MLDPAPSICRNTNERHSQRRVHDPHNTDRTWRAVRGSDYAWITALDDAPDESTPNTWPRGSSQRALPDMCWPWSNDSVPVVGVGGLGTLTSGRHSMRSSGGRVSSGSDSSLVCAGLATCCRAWSSCSIAALGKTS